MSATAERQISLQRMVTIASLAGETRTKRVLVVCRSRTVGKQYRRGVKSAGGRPKNLHLLYLNEMTP